MQGNLEAYKIWAPSDALWTQWAKPVLFADMPLKTLEALTIPSLNWITKVDAATAVIVDLPGQESVQEGLALARLGYRPVPLYNGVCGPSASSMVVPVTELVHALCKGADELPGLLLSPDAPPAFLLDSNRMRVSGKQEGKYDNRWCVFPQDMPSASYLKEKGICNVIVRAKNRQDDLAHILCRYEKQGIAIYSSDGEAPKPMKLLEPSNFKSVFYRFGVMLGLRRNAAGGFGGQIPEASEGGYGLG